MITDEMKSRCDHCHHEGHQESSSFNWLIRLQTSALGCIGGLNIISILSYCPHKICSFSFRLDLKLLFAGPFSHLNGRKNSQNNPSSGTEPPRREEWSYPETDQKNKCYWISSCYFIPEILQPAFRAKSSSSSAAKSSLDCFVCIF